MIYQHFRRTLHKSHTARMNNTPDNIELEKSKAHINEKKYKLRLGEGIIIPAHASHCFNANEQFKMISTVIKSGYDD